MSADESEAFYRRNPDYQGEPVIDSGLDALETAKLGICPVCHSRFRDDGHAYDCPFVVTPRPASQPRQEDGLEAAWAAAEAALPEDSGMWLIQGVQLVDTSDSEDLIDEQLEWEAEAVDHRRGGQPWNVTALGPTPAAALRALAARLAAEGSDEGSKP